MAARPEDCLGNGGHSDYNRHRWLLFILARLDTWDVNQLEAAGEGGGLPVSATMFRARSKRWPMKWPRPNFNLGSSVHSLPAYSCFMPAHAASSTRSNRNTRSSLPPVNS
jgi:hypothetical protein